ncbi:metal-dependent phosphohydrolase, partial [Dickeya dadantii]|nr:metal-dependent phosphohydrolase [Dickeya dadantii]
MTIMDWNTIKGLVPVSGVQPDFVNCLDAFPVLKRAKETPQE